MLVFVLIVAKVKLGRCEKAHPLHAGEEGLACNARQQSVTGIGGRWRCSRSQKNRDPVPSYKSVHSYAFETSCARLLMKNGKCCWDCLQQQQHVYSNSAYLGIDFQ